MTQGVGGVVTGGGVGIAGDVIDTDNPVNVAIVRLDSACG
jgi:hypothetical protein